MISKQVSSFFKPFLCETQNFICLKPAINVRYNDKVIDYSEKLAAIPRDKVISLL